jgi:hypothetical protein
LREDSHRCRFESQTMNTPTTPQAAQVLSDAKQALQGLLSNIRRDAPHLSGKAMGFAEQVIEKIAKLQAAPQAAQDAADALRGHIRTLRLSGRDDGMVEDMEKAANALDCCTAPQAAQGAWEVAAKCRVCGGSGKVEQFTSAAAPRVMVACPGCAGDGKCRTPQGCDQHGCHGGCLPVGDTHPAPSPAVAVPDEMETVDLIGVKADGSEHALGKAPMPPRMKARDLAREQFGSFVDDDGSDGDLCFAALETLIDWLVAQGWRCAALATHQAQTAQGDA